MQIELSVTAGIEPHRTLGEPGAHGATVAGMHGIGVSTPSAAAVAAATIGLASDVHNPNEHCNIAPATTATLMFNLPVRGSTGPPTPVVDRRAARSRPWPGPPPSR